ncbi:hypothetical protein GCM10027290_02520 [Micromonospora sonneratiae]|uniref:Uncharacterized protein n=1 Tax=Micromonospora sonneratiae TaxID=1184706 RepID=A0ABW3Y920_9ACTN
MGRKFSIQGVQFDLDDIDQAHLSRGLTGGILELWTVDGEEHVFQLWTRDSAADHEAYLILKHESGCFTETMPRWSRPDRQ